MARRPFTVFSLSFLDCICCGFGAVILLFVLMNARATESREELTKDLRGEVSKVEIEILKMEKEKVLARNALDEVVDELAKTEGLSRELVNTIEKSKEELAKQEGDTLAQVEHVNQLKADLLSLEEGIKRLKAGAESEEPGEAPVSFAGDGQRQYLTGLKLKGQRTLILVDRSGSMLAETVVDALRIRNLPEEERLQAPKWRQLQKTVEWLMAKLPMEGQYHVASYAQTTEPLLGRKEWWDAADPSLRKELVERIQTLQAAGGTSLINATLYAASMSPPPDNIVLLADGLPTMGRAVPTLRRPVGGRRRWGLFQEAVGQFPEAVPINTLLFYMEGDPMAAVGYWRLALDSRGSFLTVAEDWP